MEENAQTEDSDEEQSFYDSINELISQLWYQHGLFCASHPKMIIFFSVIVVLTCSAPLFGSSGFNIPSTVESTTTTTLHSGNESFLPHWFDGKPFLYVIQFVLTAKLPPELSTVQSHDSMRQALKPAFYVTKVITDFKDKESGQGMLDVCLNVSSGALIRQRSGLRVQDNKFLPASGCLLLSPANLWNRDFDRFSSDKEVFDDMYQTFGRPAFNILLKEFIFGTSLKQTGLYPKFQGVGPDNSVGYAVTLIMTVHQQSYVAALKEKLLQMYPLPEKSRQSGSSKNKEEEKVVHIYYKDDGGTLVELGPISVAYFVVFLYLAFSVAKIDMVKSKWGLAFSAVITVVASLVMAGGLSTFFGLVPTLHSSEIIPYLVIMVGVENTLVITKSVVSTPVDLDVKVRVAQGLSKEGKYMMKNLATEMFVIILGYFTYVPAIQEFCLFAFIGLLSDFFLQVFLFSTILSIDIRRMEISDLSRVSFQQQIMLGHSRQSASHILVPLPEDSIRNPPRCPVIPVRSKRLKLVNFWARTRMVQRACMVCAVLYFIYIVFYSVTPGTFRNFTSNLSDQNMDEEMSLSKIIEKIVADHDPETSQNGSVADTKNENNEVKLQNKDVSSTTADGWNGLSKYHWPQLLSYYNTSLLGRYISILPPVHLGFEIDIPSMTHKDKSVDLKTARPFPESPVQVPDPRHMPLNSHDPEYYLNALNCVVLGVIVMIILFFVCKYLNDLQIRPRARSSREMGLEHLVEAIPLSLKGHPQNVEHMKCTASSIVSICLSGQVRVWNRITGECTRVIKRSGEIPSSRSKCGSKKKPKHEPDKTYARSKYFKSLENTNRDDDNAMNASLPDVLLYSNNANSSAELNGHQSTTSKEKNSKSRTGSVSSCLSDNSGYDFGPSCQGGSPKITSFGSLQSLDNSWSSEEDNTDIIFSGSDEHLDNTQNETQDERRTAAVWCLDCKDDVLATGCSDGIAELWSLSSGKQICLYSESRSGITSIAFLPDSPVLVLARIDGTLDFLTLFDPAMTSRSNMSPFKRSSPKIQCKNPRNNSVISDTSPVHTVPVRCSLKHRVRAHHQPASVMVVTKNNVVTGSHDRTLKVFRTHDAVRIFTLHGHRDGITALTALQNEPNYVISGASNGGVRVWDVTTGECLQHLRGHTCSVIALACTKDNIISTSIDNSMCIWDRLKGKCTYYKLKQFPDFCSNIVMMSSNLFVTGGQGCIALWDLHAGKQIKTIPLDNGDRYVIVRNLNVCDSASIVCSYGKELRVVTFPFVMNKVE